VEEGSRTAESEKNVMMDAGSERCNESRMEPRNAGGFYKLEKSEN
jgi:hypothetical protein